MWGGVGGGVGEGWGGGGDCLVCQFLAVQRTCELNPVRITVLCSIDVGPLMDRSEKQDRGNICLMTFRVENNTTNQVTTFQ